MNLGLILEFRKKNVIRIIQPFKSAHLGWLINCTIILFNLFT